MASADEQVSKSDSATRVVGNPGNSSNASYSPSQYEDDVMKWLSFALQEGIGLNRSEFHYDKIGQAIDAIMGVDEPTVRSPKLSTARINKIQKIALELKSMLTDIKPFWVYNTNCDRYEKQADIFGKLSKSWFLRRGIDQVFRDSIDYVLAAGTGYIHLFWNPEMPGPLGKNGKPTVGDIDARAEDPRDVGIIRFGGTDRRTVQGSRGCWIRRERPTSYFFQMYPKLAKQQGIKADRIGYEKESPSQRRAREAQEAVLNESPNFQGWLFGGAPAQRVGGPAPVTDEFTIYVHDYSVNTTGKPIEMGDWVDAVDADGNKTREPMNSWSYIVQPGEARYPFGRRLVMTRYGVLEDGPGHFHHGMLPICKVTLDTWAWSRMGTSPIHPLLSLQRAVDEVVRSVQDHIRRSSKRGIVYDKKAISPQLARKLDTRKDGMKLGINPHAQGVKGAVQIVEEPPLDAAIPDWLKFLLDQMDELSGTATMKMFSQLGQIPSTETIDKIAESMTPLVRARSRSMEVFIREFAMMLASMFMQFYPLELRLRLLGADGMTFEDWDYAPGDLMPDYIDDDDYEYIDVDSGNDGKTRVPRVKQEALDRGPSAEHIRNREFLRFFDFDVTPGSLLDAATITKKLLYLQLARMGLVDHWTLCEVLMIPNVGKPPSWATDITKRLQAEKIMGLGIMASTVGRAPTAQTMPQMGAGGGITES